uniref:Fukutin n=1 Tax=Loa loa TaxID=7209 RepID=A0A1I7VCQ1_LOALO
MGILRQIQDRYTYKTLPQKLSFSNATKFTASTQVLSSILQLNGYLQNKTLFIDPRFISKMQDAQVHFMGNNQLRIGEENLDDILEPNTVMMAFFARDEPEIVEQSQHLEYRQILPVDLYSSIRWPGLLIFQAAQLFAVTNYEIQNETLVGPVNWTTFAWRFRNWAIERGMTPILHAGTLLGWYRECGIIPYTHDIDFTVFIEEYYNKFPEDVMNSSFIKLSLRFNRPEDLLEYKVYIEDSIPMDIFFLYHDQNSSWIGGLSYMTKYRFIYPLINRICATDLLGYLMYVPCNALDVIMVNFTIRSEYGKRWSEPLHSSKYVWNETPLNKKVVGTVPPEQRRNLS